MKWEMIALSIIVIAFVSGMVFDTISTNNKEIEMAKVGLQQCQLNDSLRHSIWKKKCTKENK